jgi:protein TonB
MSGARSDQAKRSNGKAFVVAFLCALLLAAMLHAGVLLFGGAIKFLFVKHTGPTAEEIKEVEIVEETKEKETPKEVKKVEEMPEPEKDQMPDTTVLEAVEQNTQPAALSAVSLADLESALGGGGGGAGGAGMNFGSGGVVGGTGAPGSGGDINSIIGGGAGGVAKPRVISSPAPEFPPAAQRKGGSITLVVLVGEDGVVRKTTVESSTEPSLEKPAMDAIKRWKFEPATFQGRKVPAKIRQVIRLGSGKA